MERVVAGANQANDRSKPANIVGNCKSKSDVEPKHRQPSMGKVEILKFTIIRNAEKDRLSC